MKTTLPHRSKRSLHTIQIFLVAFLFGSCMTPDYFPCVRSEGSPVAEARYHPGFDGVDLAMHGQVFISKGDDYSVSIEAPSNLLPYIRTRVSGGNLLIDNDRCLRNRLSEIQVYVTLPDIKSLRISGSGTIQVIDPFETGNLYMDVSGSGRISGTFFSPQITSRISGSGDIVLAGSTGIHHISISGSGQISGYALECNEAEVKISGSGHAQIKVSDKLNARISGSGNVYYAGAPLINASISGSGKIIPR